MYIKLYYDETKRVWLIRLKERYYIHILSIYTRAVGSYIIYNTHLSIIVIYYYTGSMCRYLVHRHHHHHHYPYSRRDWNRSNYPITCARRRDQIADIKMTDRRGDVRRYLCVRRVSALWSKNGLIQIYI